MRSETQVKEFLKLKEQDLEYYKTSGTSELVIAEVEGVVQALQWVLE